MGSKSNPKKERKKNMNITKKVINIAKDNINGELELIKRLIDDERNASEEGKQSRRYITDQYLKNFKGLISRTFATLENGDNIK